jgi:hypothetical protein
MTTNKEKIAERALPRADMLAPDIFGNSVEWYSKDSVIKLLGERDERLIEGIRDAVILRTQIPKGARNPTRDATVILGEEIAEMIEDIAENHGIIIKNTN